MQTQRGISSVIIGISIGVLVLIGIFGFYLLLQKTPQPGPVLNQTEGPSVTGSVSISNPPAVPEPQKTLETPAVGTSSVTGQKLTDIFFQIINTTKSFIGLNLGESSQSESDYLTEVQKNQEKLKLFYQSISSSGTESAETPASSTSNITTTQPAPSIAEQKPLTPNEIFNALYPHSLINGYRAQQDFLVNQGFISSNQAQPLTDENAIAANEKNFNSFLVSQNIITNDTALKMQTTWSKIISQSFKQKQDRAKSLVQFRDTIAPLLKPPTAEDVQKHYDFLEKNIPGIKANLPPISLMPKNFFSIVLDYIEGRAINIIRPKEAYAACGCSNYALTPPICFQTGPTGPSGLISAPVCYGFTVCTGICPVYYVPWGCNELVQSPLPFKGPFPFIYDPTTTLCGFAK